MNSSKLHHSPLNGMSGYRAFAVLPQVFTCEDSSALSMLIFETFNTSSMRNATGGTCNACTLIASVRVLNIPPRATGSLESGRTWEQISNHFWMTCEQLSNDLLIAFESLRNKFRMPSGMKFDRLWTTFQWLPKDFWMILERVCKHFPITFAWPLNGLCTTCVQLLDDL